ncbi:glycosyltransferase [Rhodococcus qingshengii]|uniref:glycosyltransferase n=1 Tax=Rhodococcus qingshengii TaxID=334542 RepID=UPI0034DED80A
MLRRLTSGTILYGYDSVVPARFDLPKKPVWVAPNSLYPRSALQTGTGVRTKIIYVGRLESAKNVQILTSAFKSSRLWEEGITLDIVGDGSLMGEIQGDIEVLDMKRYIHVHGQIDDIALLSELYSEALHSVSPGYVALPDPECMSPIRQ